MESLSTKKISTKINNLLKWGFKPKFYNPADVLFGENRSLEVYNKWVLIGSFVSDFSHLDVCDCNSCKNGFLLEANLESDEIDLILDTGEVEDHFRISSSHTYYNVLTERIAINKFSKKNVIDSLKENLEARNVEFYKDKPKGVLYLIKCGEFIKIGLSVHPMDRARNIGVKLPIQSNVLRHYIFDKLDLPVIEKRFHTFFALKRSNGEWFKLSNDDVTFIDYCVSVRGIPTRRFDYLKDKLFLDFKDLELKKNQFTNV